VKTQVRQVAGLQLKTQINRFFPRISMEIIEFIKERLKIAFYDQDYSIRKTVSSVMATIIVRGGFNIWPDLLQFLTENLTNASNYNMNSESGLTAQSIVENSIQAISIIVEDS
jgi:hypothetical protein